MATEVFSTDASISWSKRYVNKVVYGKTQHKLTTDSDYPAWFFMRVPLHSSVTLGVEATGTTGSFSLTAQITAGASVASSQVMTTSIDGDSNAEKFSFLLGGGTVLDSSDSSHIIVGFTTSDTATDTWSLTYQILASNRGEVEPITEDYTLSAARLRSAIKDGSVAQYEISLGYILNRPIIYETDVLNAFRVWNSEWEYSANDPVFYQGEVYIANPQRLPLVGESPADSSEAWIHLAAAKADPVDLTPGVSTKQLYNGDRSSLVISNATATQLRKEQVDVGVSYGDFDKVRVWHLDGDKLDMLQESELDVTATEEPTYINADMSISGMTTCVPAITVMPLEETPQFLYGAMAINVPLNNLQPKSLSFWFKLESYTQNANWPIAELNFSDNSRIYLSLNQNEIEYSAPTEEEEIPYTEPESSEIAYWAPNAEDGLVFQVTGSGGGVYQEILDVSLTDGLWSSFFIGLDTTGNYLKITLYSSRTSVIELDSSILSSAEITSFHIGSVDTEWGVDEIMISESDLLDSYLTQCTTRYPYAAQNQLDNYLVIAAESADRVVLNLEFQLAMMNYFIPVGFTYVQYEDQPNPVELWRGLGTWEEIETSGNVTYWRRTA